jgi:release factor glutamine methyltransferase
MNVTGCMSHGVDRLSSGPHGDRARMDSEMLLMHALRRDKAWLLAHGDEEVREEPRGRFVDLLERRYRGEPIQYITGECEFYGLPFKVTRDVLIPRPETEHLVEKALELAGRFSRLRIVDVGAGSGAIAVALAHSLPEAAIAAIDMSEAALAVARDNAQRNGVDGRIRFLQGDLLAPIAGEPFEIVVSNPPYVATSDRGSLSVEVREYEPELALFAGEDGLDVYRRLIPEAYRVLVRGGSVVLEIGYGQAEAVKGLMAAAGFEKVEFFPDLQGILRVAWAQRS